MFVCMSIQFIYKRLFVNVNQDNPEYEKRVSNTGRQSPLGLKSWEDNTEQYMGKIAMNTNLNINHFQNQIFWLMGLETNIHMTWGPTMNAPWVPPTPTEGFWN